MDASLGALKAPPEEMAPEGAGAGNGAASLFASLPEVCWKQVAAFAAPPDIYNLCLSSKIFFSDGIGTDGERNSASNGGKAGDSDDDDVPMMAKHRAQKKAAKETKKSSKRRKTGNKGGKATTAAAKNGGDSSEAPLLATRLLRASLLSSLGRVLEHTGSGITLESAQALADLPEGSVLIAGSAVASACLGVLWGTKGRYTDSTPDVDVYCTAKVAPLVRSWLVESANAIFTGFHDTYIDIVDDRLLYTVDSKIHHVESWSSIFEHFQENLEGPKRYFGSDRKIGDAIREGTSTVTVADIKKTDHYKEMVRWGKNVQTQYVNWKWQRGMSFPELGVPLDKVYNITPKNGGNLPFNFDGDEGIDLIVAQKGKGKKEVTPFDLLDDFDLTLCKCSFDGKKFSIPEPHLTFNGKSTMEPNRRAIVESYLKHYTPPESRYMDSQASSGLCQATIIKVRRELPKIPARFFRQVDVAARSSYVAREDNFFGGINTHDPRYQAKYGPPIQFHNWTCKLVDRLRKYQQRGIEVVGAPIIGEDDQLRKLSVTQHGG